MKNIVLYTNRSKMKLLSLGVLAAAAVNVQAVETLNSTATVTVQNAFTFAETSVLDFGTVRASAVATGTTNGSDTISDTTAVDADIALLQLKSSDGSSLPTGSGLTSAIVQLVPGAAAVYTISGVSPFATLTINLPSEKAAVDPIKMSAGTAPPGSAYFWLSDFEATVTSGTADGSPYVTATPNLTADAAGEASFTLGALLSTSDPATGTVQSNYLDLPYTGNYTITVEY